MYGYGAYVLNNKGKSSLILGMFVTDINPSLCKKISGIGIDTDNENAVLIVTITGKYHCGVVTEYKPIAKSECPDYDALLQLAGALRYTIQVKMAEYYAKEKAAQAQTRWDSLVYNITKTRAQRENLESNFDKDSYDENNSNRMIKGSRGKRVK